MKRSFWRLWVPAYPSFVNFIVTARVLRPACLPSSTQSAPARCHAPARHPLPDPAASAACPSVETAHSRSHRGWGQKDFAFSSIFRNALDVEMSRLHQKIIFKFQSPTCFAPNQSSQEVRRISAPRDRFWATRYQIHCSASPAQPPKTTEKSGHSRIGRTLSWGQVAEGKVLVANPL